MTSASLRTPGIAESAVPALVGGAVLGLFLVMATSTAGDVAEMLALMLAALAAMVVVLRPEYGVLALTSTAFLSYPRVLQGSGYLTINNALGLLLTGLLVVRLALTRRVEFLESGPIRLFVLVALAVIVNNSLTEEDPSLTTLAALDLSGKRVQVILSKLAFLVFLVTFIRTRRHVLLLTFSVVGFLLVAAPNAAMNALRATGGDVERIRAASDLGIQGTGNANRLAFLCAVGIALAAYAAREYRSRWVSLASGAAITLLVTTIVLSGSRSGVLNLVILCALLLPGSPPAWRRRLVALVVAAVLLLGGLLIVAETGHSTPRAEPRGAGVRAQLERITNFMVTERGEEGAGSLRHRLELLGVGLRILQDHPLVGVGVGNFRWLSVEEYGNRLRSAMHNSYLLTLVEGGVLLMVPYLLLFRSTWSELATTRALSRRVRAPGLGWLVEATRAMFVLFLVFSLFADLWYEVFLYLIVGLTVVLARLYREAAASRPA